MTNKLFGVCYVCYFSSHDEFVALFSTEGKAEAASDLLNAKEKIRLAALDEKPVEEYNFPYNSPPFYVREFDVSKYAAYYSPEKLLKRCPKWRAIYTVPSVGEFQIVPSNVCREEYELDVIPEDWANGE